MVADSLPGEKITYMQRNYIAGNDLTKRLRYLLTARFWRGHCGLSAQVWPANLTEAWPLSSPWVMVPSGS